MFPEPHPTARTPSSPARSAKPLGPRRAGPASFPTRTILRGFFNGSVLFLFLRSTALAAPISRTTFQWSAWTSTCLLLTSSKRSNSLKLTGEGVSRSAERDKVSRQGTYLAGTLDLDRASTTKRGSVSPCHLRGTLGWCHS